MNLTIADITLLVSFVGLIMLPVLLMLVRITSKWTRVEDRLSTIADDLRDVVTDKNKAHTEMLAQMREDRTATDRRLRWLEENLWGRNANRPN